MATPTKENLLPALSYDEASTETQGIFDNLKKAVGKVPNLYASIGNSSHALGANLAFDDALGKGTFKTVEKEIIKLASSQANNCAYCIAAHTAILKMNKFDDAETLKIRQGTASNQKHAAIAQLAFDITDSAGHPSQGSLDDFFAAGYDSAALSEVIAIVALNIMNNYIHHIGQVAVDFPAPPALD